MFFRSSLGIIALDVDGTITDQIDSIPQSVVDYLSELSSKGWKIIFITGRPFKWGYLTLQSLSFSYDLAVQNGALLLEMPSRTIQVRKYLSSSLINQATLICQKYHTDFIIYSGLENYDFCYFRPQNFSKETLKYLNKRSAHLSENWYSVNCFSELNLQNFPSIKCFAREEEAFLIQEDFEKVLGLHAPPNRDPYDPSYFVVQGTHPDATKGNILAEYILRSKNIGPVIVAGDDNNDESMLNLADLKIVMENAPQKLLSMADIIAPCAAKQGIIQGLKQAIQKIQQKTSGEIFYE